MSPPRRALLIAAVAAAMFPLPALGARDAVLTKEEALTGSDPYREAVKRFLEKQVPKVVGGEPAPDGAFPWQVSIGVSWIADPYYAHFCGGTVHRPGWIITAAHCVERTAARDIVVMAGTHKLGTGGARRNVKRIVVHGGYDRKTYDNDIALLELTDPLPTGEAIQAIPLVGPGEEPALLQRTPALVTVGWGATQEGGAGVRDLRFARVAYVERSQCNRPLSYDNQVTANMICAGAPGGGRDACQGDSGGPLTIDDSREPKLLGAVSWGEGCARPNKVGVYTRVSVFAGWVDACIQGGPGCK